MADSRWAALVYFKGTSRYSAKPLSIVAAREPARPGAVLTFIDQFEAEVPVPVGMVKPVLAPTNLLLLVVPMVDPV